LGLSRAADFASRWAQREGAVKRANELVREIGLAVEPPQGVPIVLIEDPHEQPNWVAAAGPMESALTHKFGKKVVELRESNPLIDWRGGELHRRHRGSSGG